jgi:hypothetical protein
LRACAGLRRGIRFNGIHDVSDGLHRTAFSGISAILDPGPSRINIATSALLQNEGRKEVDLVPKIPPPAKSAATIVHNVSIHRPEWSDKPSHTTAAMSAP